MTQRLEVPGLTPEILRQMYQEDRLTEIRKKLLRFGRQNLPPLGY